MPRIAITREVPDSITRCELTHLERVPIDAALAAEQHRRYERTLESLGCVLDHLPPTPHLPDSVFVEDAAVVFDEVAIMTRPGALSRRSEVATVADTLSKYRPLVFIEPPGTMDGGDVLRAGRHVFIGISTRTSCAGAEQLRDFLVPYDYAVSFVELAGCLHLKTAVTAVDDDLLLVNPDWVDVTHLQGLRLLDVHTDEPSAANVLRIGDVVLCAASSPRTQQTLESNGLSTVAIDVSELAKAEAGLTCCSLIVESFTIQGA